MRLRFLSFVFFISFASFSSHAVEDAYTEKKEAIVRSLQKLQRNRPELKESLAGVGYLEQGLRIQTYFSGETAHEVYNLPLPDDVFRSMNHALRAYKQGQPLEPQEITQQKSQAFFKQKRQPVLRSMSSSPKNMETTWSKPLPSKDPIDLSALLISEEKPFELHKTQEKFSPSNTDTPFFETAHLISNQALEREKSPPPKRSDAQKKRLSLVQKILDLRGKKGKEKEKRKSVGPLPPLADLLDLECPSEEGEPTLGTKKSPPPKRSETPKRTLAFRQSSLEPKEEKKRSLNLEIQPLAFEPIDLGQKETKQGSSSLLGLKAKKAGRPLKDFFSDYFQIVVKKKFEGTQSASYFENLDPMEEFEKAVSQTLLTEAYKPIILPIAGEKTLSPLVFVLGTLNQIFFTRFSDQPVYTHGEKVNPVAQSRFDCFYALELIEQLNGFQQSEETAIVSFFSDILIPLEEMKQNMKPIFEASLEIQQTILGLAETAPPETLEKIGIALYMALYDSFPYVLSLDDFKNPRELLVYLEHLAQHHLATFYLFNPESVRERFEFRGMNQRQAVVEALNHTAKRFKKPPFDHDLERFEATKFLERYVSELHQEAEVWVIFGFESLARALK